MVQARPRRARLRTLTVPAAVDNFATMTKRRNEPQPQQKAPPARWRGDAVEDRPGDEAERAAERAEGNTPVLVSAERDRIEEPPDAAQPQRVHGRSRPTDDEEIADTAEEHQERRDAGERPPRGKL